MNKKYMKMIDNEMNELNYDSGYQVKYSNYACGRTTDADKIGQITHLSIMDNVGGVNEFVVLTPLDAIGGNDYDEDTIHVIGMKHYPTLKEALKAHLNTNKAHYGWPEEARRGIYSWEKKAWLTTENLEEQFLGRDIEQEELTWS